MVSIGLFVYNGERYLSKALDSLLAQTFKDFELIISDNASTDSTETICREYLAKDSRIKYFRQNENIGIFNNFRFVREKGVAGKYFMWAAHDDLWEKNWLEVLVSDMKPSDFAVRGLAVHIDENAIVIGKTNVSSFKKGQILKTFLDDEKNGRGFYWYALFNNQLLQKIDLMSLDSTFGSDTFFISHLVQYGDLRVVDKTAQYYRQHIQSTTKKFSKDWFGLRRYIYHLFPINTYIYTIRIVNNKYKLLILLASPIKYIKTQFSHMIKLLRLIFTGSKY